jgi:hypothetical protein
MASSTARRWAKASQARGCPAAARASAQTGQVGQAPPLPVALTRPPETIATSVVAVAARARRRRVLLGIQGL